MKKRFQQIVDTLLKRGNISAEDRAELDSDEQAIVDTAKLLISARHENKPYRMEFKENLEKKVLALLHQKETKRQKTKKTIWRALHIKTLAGSGVALVAVAAVVAFSLFQQSGLINIIKPGESGGILIPAVYAHDNFTITPEVVDNFGVISEETDFLLTSQSKISKNDLEKYLRFSNDSAFTIKTIKRGYEYTIDPVETLRQGEIVQVSAATVIDGEEGLEPFTYHWVFEVADHFKIQSTAPADRSVGVPVNNAVEIIVSHTKTQDISSYLEIQPNHSVRIEQDFRTIKLIPETPWEKDVLYTITLKNGFGVQPSFIPASANQSEWQLNSDYQFSFTTGESASLVGSSFSYTSEVLQSKPGESVQVSGYGYRLPQDAPLNVKVHRLDATVVDQVIAKTSRLDNWIPTQIKTQASKQLLQEFGLTNPIAEYSINGEEEYSRNLFALNALQTEGVYLVEASIAGQVDLLYWSVSSVGAYILLSETSGLVWTVDTESNQPLEGVSVYSRGQLLGTSNQEGIVTVSAIQIAQLNQQEAFKLVQGEQTTIHPVRIWNDPKDQQPEYTGFFHLDQYLVHPDDTIRYWGLIDREGGSLNEVRAEVTLWNAQYGSYSNVKVQEEIVSVNDQGFFTGSMQLQDLRDGYYSFTIYDGEHYFKEQSFEVTVFATPELSLIVNPQYQRIEAGESNLVTISTARFDGTPARFIDLQISGDYTGVVSTNELGEAQVTVPSRIDSCGEYGCNSSNLALLRVIPIGSYETEVVGNAYWTVTQDYTDIKIETNEKNQQVEVSAKVKGVEYLTNDEQYPSDGDKKMHIAQGVPFEASVIAITSSKSPLFSELNPLTNETDFYYDFSTNETTVENQTGLTNELGEVNFSFTKQENTNYKIIVKALDSLGRYDLDYTYLTDYSLPFGKVYVENETDEPFIRQNGTSSFFEQEFWVDLENEDVQAYQVGDSIGVKAILGEANMSTLPNDAATLFFTLSPNLSNYFVSMTSRQDIELTEEYLPNVHIGAATVYEGKIYFTHYRLLELNLSSDPYELTISVDTDKNDYAIRDKVKSEITITDTNGNPVETLVNVNVLDKAYLDLDVFAGSQNPLNDLFSRQYERILVNTATHNSTLGPDGMGGGGGDERVNFLEQATYQFVQTDKNGKGVVEFELPDNITTWVIVATTGTNQYQGGLGKKEITVAQSFVVQAIQSDSYILGDDIIVSARNYSDQLSAKSEVTYSLYGPLLAEEGKHYSLGDFPISTKQEKAESIAIVDFPIETTGVGKYVYAIRALSGEYEDIIIKTFSVLPGRSLTQKQEVVTIEENWQAIVPEEAEGRVSVRFASPLGANAYTALSRLCSCASKLDYIVAQQKITELKQQYFDLPAFGGEDIIGSEYKHPDGGYARFPFGSGDSTLSSSIATLLGDKAQTQDLQAYFESLLSDDSTPNEISLALRGLAGMQKPYYAELKAFIANENIQLEDRVLLADAFILYGDYNQARLILDDILVNTAVENGQRYFQAEGIDSTTQIQWYTELTRLIAFTVGDSSWKEFDAYLNAQESIVDPISYTRFWELRLERQPISEMSFVVIAGVEEQFVTLKGFESFGLNLTKEQLQTLSLESVRGNVQALYQYDVAGQTPQSIEGVTVSRIYEQGAGPTTVINPNKEIDIEIEVRTNASTAYGNYALTDLLPSGLQAITRGMNWGTEYSRCEQSAYDTSAHKAKAFLVLNKECPRILIRYRARTVATAGEYLVEGLSLIKLDDPSIKYIGENEIITIR